MTEWDVNQLVEMLRVIGILYKPHINKKRWKWYNKFGLA